MPTPRDRHRFVGTLLLVAALAALGAAPARPARAAEAGLTVAAAASLQAAFRQIAADWAAAGGTPVTLSFGASGKLARQVAGGAPFDVYAAANRSWVDWLDERGLVVPETIAVYAAGVVALAVSDPARLPPGPGPVDATGLGALRDPGFRVIAMANPAYAPYGVAAKQALTGAGLYDALLPRVVLADNVRQALTYVETGNADAGLVAASLLAGSDTAWRPVAAALHRPLHQALAVVRASPRQADARAFAAYVLGPGGRRVLRASGLRAPGEE